MTNNAPNNNKRNGRLAMYKETTGSLNRYDEINRFNPTGGVIYPISKFVKKVLYTSYPSADRTDSTRRRLPDQVSYTRRDNSLEQSGNDLLNHKSAIVS